MVHPLEKSKRRLFLFRCSHLDTSEFIHEIRLLLVTLKFIYIYCFLYQIIGKSKFVLEIRLLVTLKFVYIVFSISDYDHVGLYAVLYIRL